MLNISITKENTTKAECMSKIVALDLGMSWTGMALSDALKITCKPYKTVAASDLEEELHTVLSDEPVETVVVGLPTTMKGTDSDQTRWVHEQSEKLRIHFLELYPDLNWVLWDERLTSKRASEYQQEVLKQKKVDKKVKHQEQALAAAFILQNYLSSLMF